MQMLQRHIEKKLITAGMLEKISASISAENREPETEN